MKGLGLFSVAPALLILAAAGCGMPASVPSAGLGSVAPIQQSVAAPSAKHGPHKKLAGKYTGTIEWSEGGLTTSAALETILRFNFKNIRGPFRISETGQETRHLRLYGRIRSKNSETALLALAIYNKAGNYATGNGNITNGVFFGRLKTVHGPAVTLQFTATKN